MTINPLTYRGTGLPFAGSSMHVDVRPNAVITGTAAAADKAADTTQGIRPRRPEPA